MEFDDEVTRWQDNDCNILLDKKLNKKPIIKPLKIVPKIEEKPEPLEV